MKWRTLPATAPVTSDKDGLPHIACPCSPTINLCGQVVEFHGFTDGPLPADVCVVCADLDDLPCERCGR